MGSRLLNLLLCAMLLGPMTLPAWAIARPENRVGKIFSAPLKTTSADLDKPLEPRRESRCYVYDFASGMRIYLYCQANPINGVDPSGHFTSMGEFTVVNAGLQPVMRTGSGAGIAAFKAHALKTLTFKIGAYAILTTMVAENVAMLGVLADAYINGGNNPEEQRLQIKRLVKLRLEQLEQENGAQLLYHYTKLSSAQDIVRANYIYPTPEFTDPSTGMIYPQGAYATDISPIGDYTQRELARTLYFDESRAAGANLSTVVVLLNQRPRGFTRVTTHQYYRRDGQVYALEWLPNPMKQ